MDEVTFRPGRREDSAIIAKLFLISSDGLAEYIWSHVAEPGETPEQAGARRYAREGVAFSFENCVVAERDGAVIGMAHSFPMEQDPDAEPEADPVLRPYSELEDYGSLYLSSLAIVERYRNHGYGGKLMELVNVRAKELHLLRLSLICFERNEPAMRFYQRLGFTEVDRRAVVPHPTLHYPDGDAILLVRAVW